MGTLTLRPASDTGSSSVWTSTGANRWSQINSPLSSPTDSTYIETNPGQVAAVTHGLTPTPLDFDKMDSVVAKIRFQITGRVTEGARLRLRIVDSASVHMSNTVVASVNQNVSLATFDVTMTGLDTVSGKATWDGARLQFHVDQVTSDPIVFRVVDVELNGVYTASAEPPPTTPPASQELLITQARIDTLPTTGAAWDAIVTASNAANTTTDNLLLTNLDDFNEGPRYLACALRWARTGHTASRDKVVTALRKIIGSDQVAPTAGNEHANGLLAVSRNLAPFILAADIIGFDKTTTGTRTGWTTISWHHWLVGYYDASGGTILDRLIGGHARWNTIRKTHRNSATNWGGAARATAMAVALSTENAAQYADTVKTMKAACGLTTEHRAYPDGTTPPNNGEDGFQTSSSFTPSMNWADPYNPSANVGAGQVSWYPINPVSSGAKSGICVEDAHRSGTAYPVMDDTAANYIGEMLGGQLLCAILMHRQGDPSGWTVADAALSRAFAYMQADTQMYAGGWIAGNWNTSSARKWLSWVMNYYTGSSYPTVTVNNGRLLAHTDWMFAGTIAGDDGPVRRTASGGVMRTATGVLR